MALTLPTVAVAALSTTLLWALYKIIYNLLLSPLSSIPGPLLARLTPWYLVLIDLAGIRTRTLHAWHAQYGPVLRVAPNELSFAGQDAIKEIYGSGGAKGTEFIKAKVYEKFSVPPLGIFSLRSKREHGERRRLLSHAFAMGSVVGGGAEELVGAHLGRLRGVVRKGEGKVLDVLLLFRLVAFDIVGDLFIGQDFHGLEGMKMPQFMHDMDNHFLVSAIEINFPWLYTILLRAPIPPLRRFLQSRNRLVTDGQIWLQQYIDRYGRQAGRKQDLLSKIISAKSDTGEPPLSDLATATEVCNLVFAGSDTTSMTLTYLFWELARNPTWQVKLREELRTRRVSAENKAGDDNTLPRYKDLVNLPLLDATIEEALRLHPAAPASLPRETPKGGRVLSGYTVPEGTTVSTQCYTPQRDPIIFAPNPDTFDPSRWLFPPKDNNSNSNNNSSKDHASTLAAMKEYMLPFSRGPRACLGKNLAMMELKLITAVLLTEFSVRLPGDGDVDEDGKLTAVRTTEESMVMTDHFLILPKAGRCGLVFEG